MDYVLIGVIIGGLIGGLIGLLISIPLMIKQSKINKGLAVGKRGNRFERHIAFTGNYNSTGADIDRFLTASGYNKQQYGQEIVYRKGNGFWVAAKFIKFSIVPQGILIEAFIIAFGVKEMGLDGFTGIAAKKPLKRMTEQIVDIIMRGSNGFTPN